MESAADKKLRREYEKSIVKRGKLGTIPTRLRTGAKAEAHLRYEADKWGNFRLYWELYMLNPRTQRPQYFFDDKCIQIPPKYQSKLIKILQELETDRDEH